jgi:hypothetical protein
MIEELVLMQWLNETKKKRTIHLQEKKATRTIDFTSTTGIFLDQ